MHIASVFCCHCRRHRVLNHTVLINPSYVLIIPTLKNYSKCFPPRKAYSMPSTALIEKIRCLRRLLWTDDKRLLLYYNDGRVRVHYLHAHIQIQTFRSCHSHINRVSALVSVSTNLCVCCTPLRGVKIEELSEPFNILPSIFSFPSACNTSLHR